MSVILNKINRVILEDGDVRDPIIVNPRDQAQAAKALHNTRGPCIGWEDYIAGRDYTPPYVFNTADSAGTVKGRAGVKNINSPAIPIGPKDDKANPHSAKYGGVRPWDPNEVLTVLMTKTDDLNTTGIIHKIMYKPRVQRAFEMTGRPFRPDDVIDLGLHAAFRYMLKDQNRVGVRFTSHIGTAIEDAMSTGLPPGFGDEYRKARGLLGKLESVGKKAMRAIQIVQSNGDESDPKAQKAVEDADRQLQSVINDVEKIQNPIDPKPGVDNDYGFLVTDLISAINKLRSAMLSGDVNKMQLAIDNIVDTKEDITDKEDLYRERGPNTDTLITKPKSRPAIRTGGLTVTGDSGKEIEVTNTIDRGSLPGISSMGTWKFEYKDGDDVRSQTIDDPVAFIRTRLGRSHDDAREAINVSNHIKIPASGSNPAGVLRHHKSDAGSDYEAQALDISKEPEMQDALVRLVKMASEGHGKGSKWHAKNALNAIANMRYALRHETKKTNYTVRPFNQQVDVRATEDGDFELFDPANGEVLSIVGSRIRAKKEFERLSQLRRGFNVTNAQSGEVVDTFDDETEANKLRSSLMRDGGDALLDNVGVHLTVNNYGDYFDEISDVLTMTKIARRANNQDMLDEIGDELSALEEVATEDFKHGDGEISKEAFSTPQYRVLLRLYGISEYPEKGTNRDPELMPDGQLSDWAKNGYPKLTSNKEIATDMGVSNVRISQIRKKVNEKLPLLIASIKDEMFESLDLIDLEILTEAYLCSIRIFLEDMNIRKKCLLESANDSLYQSSLRKASPLTLFESEEHQPGLIGSLQRIAKGDPQEALSWVVDQTTQKFRIPAPMIHEVLSGNMGVYLAHELTDKNGNIRLHLPNWYKEEMGQRAIRLKSQRNGGA